MIIHNLKRNQYVCVLISSSVECLEDFTFSKKKNKTFIPHLMNFLRLYLQASRSTLTCTKTEVKRETQAPD